MARDENTSRAPNLSLSGPHRWTNRGGVRKSGGGCRWIHCGGGKSGGGG